MGYVIIKVKGDVYRRDREDFSATILLFFIVDGWIPDIVGQMGASLICFNYRSWKPMELLPQNGQKLPFLDWKWPFLDVFAF